MLRHSDNLDKKDKVKYDLYKILRMNVLLNQKEVDNLTIDKFREAAVSIDKMLDEEYDEKIQDFFYETTTLEEEGKRLKKLVAFVNERIDKRKELLEDFRSVTNKELNGLSYIDRSGEIDLYEAKLKLIRGYLDNTKLIEVNKKELEALRNDLVKEYDTKSENEITNLKLEETLYNIFIDSLYEMKEYSSIESYDIEEELEQIKVDIKESKEQKETFESAFNNLKESGISGELELEYASYVENARRNYYYIKERELILNLYRLIKDKEQEYGNLYIKRENIKKLLEERIILRKEALIKEKDKLISVYEVIKDQQPEIESEKEAIENISILSERVKIKENRIEELEKDIARPEVLALLNEFKLIETYNADEEIDTNEDIDEILPDEEVEEPEEEKKEEVPEIIKPEIQKPKKEKKSPLELLDELLKEEEKKETLELKEKEHQEQKVVEEQPVETKEEEKTETPEIVEETPVVVPKEEVVEEQQEDTKEYKPNQIKNSEVLLSMNYGLSRLKAISVMKRVGDMLGVNAKKAPKAETEKPKTVTPSAAPQPIETPKEEVKQENTEDLFWTQNEFVELKEETEEKTETNTNNDIFINDNNIKPNENDIFMDNQSNNADIFANNTNINVNSEPVFDFKMPEINNETLDEQLFNNSQPNAELIFPEPAMPNGGQNILPENKEEKFAWPDDGQTFDSNGIFPS